MVDYAERTRSEWTDGAPLDVAHEMMRLTLSIAGKTLFDLDVESQAAEVGRALTAVMESFWTTMLPFVDVLDFRRRPIAGEPFAGKKRRSLAQLPDRLFT